MTRNLPLQQPCITITIKNTTTKKLLQNGRVPVAFDVVIEIWSEDVFNGGGVGGANAVREAEETGDLESEWWGCWEHVGDPVVEAVAVAEEADEVADEWVGLGRWGLGFGGGVMVAREEVEDGEDG